MEKKTRAEINKIGTKKHYTKNQQNKNWFFEKINKIDKPLANLTNRRENTQISKIRNENREIPTNREPSGLLWKPIFK
jgi:hypothetical protein